MRDVTGALVAFEGLDQSGKETQARRLEAHLEAQGRETTLLTFPCYTTPIAKEIAEALQGRRHFSPDVLQLLFIANRYEYAPRIREDMSRGAVVLCDRYLASSIAYGEAQGLDAGWLFDVQRLLPQPTFTVFIDIAPETAVMRKASGRDRFERDMTLLANVRKGYLRLAVEPTWHRVDGQQPIDVVADEVRRIAEVRLAPR